MKVKTYKVTVIFSIFLTLLSCATTKISYINNPSVHISSFTKILVFAPFDDLNLRKKIEKYFVKEFTELGKMAVSSMKIIPPIKVYSEDELSVIFSNEKIDAFLYVTLIDAYSDQAYIPSRSTTTSTSRISGNSIRSQSTTKTSGGYYVSKPRISFNIELFDIQSGDLAWKATTFTAGSAFTDNNILFKSIAEKVVKSIIIQP